MSSRDDGGSQTLIVVLVLLVLAAVAYNMIVSAKVAQALRNVETGIRSGTGELGGFRGFLERWGLW